MNDYLAFILSCLFKCGNMVIIKFCINNLYDMMFKFFIGKVRFVFVHFLVFLHDVDF